MLSFGNIKNKVFRESNKSLDDIPKPSPQIVNGMIVRFSNESITLSNGVKYTQESYINPFGVKFTKPNDYIEGKINDCSAREYLKETIQLVKTLNDENKKIMSKGGDLIGTDEEKIDRIQLDISERNVYIDFYKNAVGSKSSTEFKETIDYLNSERAKIELGEGMVRKMIKIVSL